MEANRPPGAARTLALLLGCRARALANLLRFGGFRTAAGATLILGVACGFVWFDYLFFFKLIAAIQEKLEFLAPYMIHQLVHTLFLSFFGLLALSSLSAAVSGFFMSREIPFLVATPVSRIGFMAQRFVLVFGQSAWMILVFGTPPFLAYAKRLGLGWGFFAGWFPVFALLLVIPVLVGCSLAIVLMRLLPASRVHQTVSFLSLAMMALIVILFRMSRPERLFMDVPEEEVMGFVKAMTVPESPYLPTSWATNAVIGLGDVSGRGAYLENLTILAVGALATALVFWIVFRVLYWRGLSDADVGRIRATRRDVSVAESLLPRLGRVTGNYLTKDILLFVRDPARWTQAFLLLALVVLYIFNAKSFPLSGGFFYRNMVAFLNLAITGFVLSSLCVRFVFPSVSLEGRSIWITLAAPVPMRRFFLAKFLFAAAPLCLIATLLTVATSLVIGVSTDMTLLFTAASLAMALALVGLNLGMGAVFPRFDFENEAQIPASPGGVLTMIVSLFYIGAMVVLLASPVYHSFALRLGLHALTHGDALFGLIGAGALSAVVAVVPVGWGLRRVGEWR